MENYVSVEEDFSHIYLYIATLHPPHHMEHCNLNNMYVLGPWTDGIYILVVSLCPEMYMMHKGGILLLET